MGWYHYSRSVPHVRQHPRAGYQNGKLCRFGDLVKGTLEERREPSGQRCAYARRCSEGVAAPLGCVICLQLGDVAVFSLCAQYFLNVRGGGGITTLGAFHTVRKPCVARGRTANFAALGSWPGALPKNAESLRNSDAPMRVAVPRRRGPAGLRYSVCNLVMLLFFRSVCSTF